MDIKTDLVLVRPNDKKSIYGNLANSVSAVEPPLWAGLLAAFVRERGFSVNIYDAEVENASPLEGASVVLSYNPQLVCIVVTGSNLSASTWKMYGTRLLIEEIRKLNPNSKIMLWGLHPSALPERTMLEEDIDFVCQGEGFTTIINLLERLTDSNADPELLIPGLWRRNGGKAVANERADLIKLDDLPIAAWDLLPMNKYRAHNWHCFDSLEKRMPYGVIYTSLGCPFDCSFCALKALFGANGVRFRSPQSIVKEIGILVNQYGVRNIKILDECFVLRESHVIEICDLILYEGFQLNMWAYARIDTINEKLLAKMKQAGMNWLAYGIESGNKNALNNVDKRGYDQEQIRRVISQTKAAGINVVGNFMFGLPDDSFDTMRETLEFAIELNCEYTNFYTTMAYPGSQLYHDAIKDGIKLPESWLGYSQYSAEALPLPTKHLTSEEVLRYRDYAFSAFHSQQSYLELLEKKFDRKIAEHIREILKIPLKRNIEGWRISQKKQFEE